MLKKIALIFCILCTGLAANANASPYVQLNAGFSPSTTINNITNDVLTEKAFGLSTTVEGIFGTQGRLFAYEVGLAYTSNPAYNSVESSITDFKLSALLAPKLGIGFMAVIPYIGPQIGYSSYSVDYISASESHGALLYGGKAGIKVPFTLLYLDFGASYLKRRGTMFSPILENTNVTGNLNFFLGVGFRLF